MPTEIDKAFRLALEVANDGVPATAGKGPSAEPLTGMNDIQRPEGSTRSLEEPLSVLDVAAAFTIVHSIARERDPYRTHDSSRRLPENDPRTVRALCVVAAYLSQNGGRSTDADHSASTPEAPVSQDGGIPKTMLDTGSVSEPRGSMPLLEFLDQIERREILRTLEECKFNRTEAARVLGITFRAMRYRMERLGIK